MSRRWVAVGALATAVVVGCGDDRLPPPAPIDEEVDVLNAEPQLYGGLFRELARFIGEEVVVSGEVIDVLISSIFRLAGPLEKESILVVPAGPEEVVEDHVVKVTGRIDDLDVRFLEREPAVTSVDEVLKAEKGEQHRHPRRGPSTRSGSR